MTKRSKSAELLYYRLHQGVRSLQDDAVKQLSQLARTCPYPHVQSPKATATIIFLCEQHGALAVEFAHLAEVDVLFLAHDKLMC